MALHSFCGILTLQVGVAMIAVIFWLVAALTFVVNVFEFTGENGFPIYILVISSFVILLTMCGLISFFSAYNESNSLCMAGVALTSMTAILWILLSSLSFYNDQQFLTYVCIHDRCPETFWLAPLKYRLENKGVNKNQTVDFYPEYGEHNKTNEHSTEHNRKKRDDDLYTTVLTTTYQQKNENIPVSPTTYRPTNKNIVLPRAGHSETVETAGVAGTELDDAAYMLASDDQGDDVRNSIVLRNGYNFGFPLVGAVILFLLNFFYFLFSILILWSYGQELAWTNTYLQDLGEYVCQ